MRMTTIAATLAWIVWSAGPAFAADAGVPAAATAGIDDAATDPSIDPCDDIYLHACGGFIQSTQVDAAAPVVDMTRQRFEAKLGRHLQRLAPEAAQREAAVVAAMTASLAQHQGDRWDAASSENPRLLTQIEALAPAIDWRGYFAMVAAPADRTVNLTSPDDLKAVDRALTDRPIEDLRAYLRWACLFSLRGELPAPYDAAFADMAPPLRVLVNDTSVRCRDATIRAMGVEFSRQHATGILGRKAGGL